MKWLIGLLIAGALVGIGFWAYGAIGVRKVEVAAPERREAIRAIYATGSVKAEQIARLRPELGGKVLQLIARVGEEIRQGELVMEVEAQEQEDAVSEQTARVREASVTVSEAETNLQRETDLLAQGASTQEAVDKTKAAYDRARAFLKTVRATLATRKSLTGKGKLIAPITGIVTKVNVNAGDIVPANMEAVTIIDPFSFKIYAEIDELDINRIRPGQEAVISFESMPRSRFKARVERIIPQADEVTKTLPVILNLLETVPNLSDGLTATVNIVQERRPNALTIPSTAILAEKNGKATIFLVTEHNKLEKREVSIGVRGEEYVEVTQGLREDERVALNPDQTWKSGDEVELDKEKMREKVKKTS
ncbi:MAG: efflux RND transporter periplasmic adaptor subunit [Bacteroidota bacterium]